MAEGPNRPTTLKQRAADARAHAAAAKKWTAHITAASHGTSWRVSSSWIEQRDGALCAELTHINTGKLRSIRLATMDTIDSCRVLITGATE